MDGVQVKDPEGVVRQWWEDSTSTYHEFDAEGTETLARPFTPEEQADADWRADAVEEQAARDALVASLEQQVILLQKLLDTPNADINASPARHIKDVARALRETIQALLQRVETLEP